MRVISADWDPWDTEPAPEPLDPADLTDRDILLLVRKDAEANPLAIDAETIIACVDQRLKDKDIWLPVAKRTMNLTADEWRLLDQ